MNQPKSNSNIVLKNKKEVISMMNYVIIMGRLKADPELRQTYDGIPFCNFNVAFGKDYRKDTETKGMVTTLEYCVHTLMN